jgi:hypothetical protein
VFICKKVGIDDYSLTHLLHHCRIALIWSSGLVSHCAGMSCLNALNQSLLSNLGWRILSKVEKRGNLPVNQ